MRARLAWRHGAGGVRQRRGQSGAGRPWAWGPTQAEQREGHSHIAKDDVFSPSLSRRAQRSAPAPNSQHATAAAGWLALGRLKVGVV